MTDKPEADTVTPAAQLQMSPAVFTALHQAFERNADAMVGAARLADSVLALEKRVELMEKSCAEAATSVIDMDRQLAVYLAPKRPSILDVMDRIGSVGRWLAADGGGWRVVLFAVVIIFATVGWLPRLLPFLQLFISGDLVQ